jgi:hypothetical protein
MEDWSAIASSYPGFSLAEIKEMTPVERHNWLELARENGKVVRK